MPREQRARLIHKGLGKLAVDARRAAQVFNRADRGDDVADELGQIFVGDAVRRNHAVAVVDALGEDGLPVADLSQGQRGTVLLAEVAEDARRRVVQLTARVVGGIDGGQFEFVAAGANARAITHHLEQPLRRFADLPAQDTAVLVFVEALHERRVAGQLVHGGAGGHPERLAQGQNRRQVVRGADPELVRPPDAFVGECAALAQRHVRFPLPARPGVSTILA